MHHALYHAHAPVTESPSPQSHAWVGPALPFAIHFDKLGCPASPPACGGPDEPGIYALRLSDNIDPTVQKTVHMGETSTAFAIGGWTFDIHNNRTSYYGGCDEIFARRYWIKLSGMN